MISILVVDDEALVRRDLVYKVGKSGYSFDWIMEAGSAEEALDIVRETRPDIMLTDIMMGRKSGLDLVEETLELSPKTVAVIICGYPDFTFAQRALKLGVTDYLLKPVTQRQLSALLAKVCAEAEARRNAGELRVENYILKNRLATRDFQEQIKAMFSGTANYHTHAIIAALPEGVKVYQVQILRADTQGEPKEKENEAYRFGVRNIAEELGEGRLIAVNGQSRREVVCIMGSFCRDAAAEDELKRLAEQVRGTVEKHLGFRTDSGLSCVSETLASSGYLEARNALDLRFGRRQPQDTGPSAFGCCYMLKPQAGEQKENYLEPDMALFKRLLNAGDARSAVNAVRGILERFRGSLEPGIRDVYVELVAVLSRTCYRKGVDILPFLGYENISGSVLDDCATLDDAENILIQIVERAMGGWVRNLENTSDVLRQVKQHIDDHFTQSELCTKELASKFCISLGYLSASYKKTYGVTISKYIISRRIEYAAKLLADTELSIQNISENSGFNNLSYFMRVFKGYYGETPARYREKASGREVRKN